MNQTDSPGALQWRATSVPPVPPDRFGEDHWDTFARLETSAVNYRGTIVHDAMRCHHGRHPIMLLARKKWGPGGDKYPTYLAGGDKLPDHDDYDCLDDLAAAGLVEIHMPRMVAGHHVGSYYVDAYDKPIVDMDGALIQPDFLTGLLELRLCAYATVALTEAGRQVAGALRAHRAAGGDYDTFRME